MAEYDLTPLEVDEDLQSTYDLLKSYFIRGNNTFNIVADYISEDSFSIDIVRAYSFVASTHRASVHLSGIPTETGTKIRFHAKSVETQENLEKEIRDRIEEVLGHMIEQKRGLPVIDKNDTSNPEKEKRQLIITVAALAIIAIGAGITGILSQYSGFWSI
jgi:hypothetical protein